MSSSARFWRIFPVLLVGAAALYLNGNRATALWDRDEPRYAECSREMLQSGNWVVPMYLGAWRLEKPAGIYWAQLLSMKVFGENEAAVRLPSTLGTLGTAVVLGLIVKRFVGTKRALWAVFIFCTCGLVIMSSKMCITDAALLFFVASGQACMAAMYAANRRGRRTSDWITLFFWGSMGGAGLIKGPLAVGMHCVTIAILLIVDHSAGMTWRDAMRWWREFRPILGLPVLALIISPWLILAHERAPGLVKGMLFRIKYHASENLDGHAEPPGYHLLLIFGTFFPWSLLLPTAIVVAWRRRRIPIIRFAIAATMGPWLLMELVRVKLPFYVLPAFPGLAFLTGDAIVRCLRGQYKELKTTAFLIAAGVWGFATLGIALAPWLAAHFVGTVGLPVGATWVYSVVGVAYAGFVCAMFWTRRPRQAVLGMGIGMAAMIFILFGGIFPALQSLRLSERLVDQLRPLGGVGADQPMVMINYEEPSLAFYQGGGAREAPTNDYLTVTPPEEWPKWIAVTKDIWDALPAERKRDAKVVVEQSGIDYGGGGKETTVVILEKTE